MNPRIPLVAAVVGALLVGGATTGGTYASWSSQRQLTAHSVSSGQMSYTATTPAGVTVSRVAGATADTTLVLDDTSAGKKLVQRITATVGATPTGVTATVGTSCPGAATTSVDTTPTSADQTLCVRVTSSTTAVSGNVTINLSSAQRPVAGWTTAAITRQVPVTVTDPGPSAPSGLSCNGGTTGSNGGTGVRLTWTLNGSTSYKIYQALFATPDTFTVVGTPGSSTSTFTTTGFAQNEVRYYRITGLQGASESMPSATLRVDRNGNSNNFTCVVQ